MSISTVPTFLLPSFRYRTDICTTIFHQDIDEYLILNRGDTVYNTEGLKESRFIDAKAVLGSQQLLMKVMNN